MATPDHYEALGVPVTASEQEIVRAYRTLVRQHHPDRVGPSGEEITAQLNHAYDVLSDPAKRRDYDRDRQPPAAAAADWVQPDMSRSFKTAAPPAQAGPSAGEWRQAFPPGSVPLFVTMALSFLVLGGCLVAAWFSGAQLFALISLIGGVMASLRKPKPAAWVLLSIPVAAGFTSLIWRLPLPPDGGYLLLTMSVGWAVVLITTWRYRTVRRRRREAAQWAIVQEVSAATGQPLAWVVDVQGGEARVEDADSGAQTVVRSWGEMTAGTWVVLNESGLVIASAPGDSFRSSRWLALLESRRSRA